MGPSILTIFNSRVDPILDTLLNACLDSGIKSMSATTYFINIEFNNDIHSSLWNRNKYYAWLEQGYIGKYKFFEVRPKRKTMKRLDKAIIDFNLKNNK